MPASPTAWYYSIDSVPRIGPLNVLFARDIGCACLAASVGVMGKQGAGLEFTCLQLEIVVCSLLGNRLMRARMPDGVGRAG